MQNPAQSHPLQRYLNSTVTVYYHTSYSDSGALTYLDAHWVELVKANGERLLIPTSGIRIIKLQTAAEADSNTLVRASAPDSSQEER
ncbi:hypothetical protein CWRG_02897 [Chthonomonas calidirosea]|uniref:hypothetical protein n=1 Tax=Chthonomonas calidirosea TaxID=454171 RepID=UPI0006DD4D5F|nr:hypothetical protein [Chthonomonas calidirosea]CEK20623.1 hypothetical protein CWRG_02897 [Chthonomonas calidirosea]